MYILEVPYFSLKKTFESGQNLRWIRVNDNKYIVINGDKALKVEQSKDRIIFDCTEDEVLNSWWEYFDLALDYSKIYYKIRAVDDDFKVIANRAKGVHLIKQNLFETFVSAFFDPEVALDCVDEIARRTGVKHSQSMKEMGIVVWYEFPSPTTLIRKQNCLNGVNLFGKNENIIKLAELFADGWLDEELMRGMECDDVLEYLDSFEMFSDAEKYTVCVRSLGFKDIMFNDSEFEQAIKSLGFDFDSFCEWYLSEDKFLANNASILRYFLLYHYRNKISKITPEMML